MKILGLDPPKRGKFLADGFTLAADVADGTAEYDENGVPIAWRLLKKGSNPLVKNGVHGSIELDGEDMRQIISYHQAKDELIPIDSRHYLYLLANQHEIDENELLKRMPQMVGAMGFGKLELRKGDEELWICAIQWAESAYKLMKEKIFRYFSPAIRGLTKSPLRVTSVALENEPCLNSLDAFAAQADDDEDIKKFTTGEKMNRIQKAIAGLLRLDSIALAADGDNPDVAAAIEGKAKLITQLRETLKLPETVTDETILAALKGAIEKAGGFDALKQELDQIKADQEVAKRDALVEKGLADGKLTYESAEAWAKKQDAAALAAYLEHAPVVVALGKVSDKVTSKEVDDVALSAEDENAIRTLKLDREKYINQLKKYGRV